MRRERYVDDILDELKQPVEQKARVSSWQALHEQLSAINFESGSA
jgi:hypothetical protein